MSSNMQPQYLAFVTAFLQTDLLSIEGYVINVGRVALMLE